MANEKDLAVLSLYVYEADSRNKPDIPTGWSILTDAVGTSGFAYAVFQGSAHEIVISYRGSDDGVDWLTNLGLTSTQELQAAQIAVQYINQGANVSFTGHSLGGGLAATMAVWFNRPATVFDPAPTQNAATDPVLVNQGMQAIVGDRRVDAKGATITLTEGQTEVAFALVQKGAVIERALAMECNACLRQSPYIPESIADYPCFTGTIGLFDNEPQAANAADWRVAA